MTATETYWSGKLVLVTGGASFIGSTLTDQLLAKGAKKVRIVDDLTSGHLGNLKQHLGSDRIDFIHADLREPGITRAAMAGVDTVFHLAADHGGRGYVDLHQAGPASNFFLDGLVFAEALKAKVKKVVFASSGCVYPNFLQADTNQILYLTEGLTKGPNDADNTYGWAKLMGEFTLQAYAKEHGMGAASCRYFTVYGPRGVENHAVIAMIARAFLKQNPFEVWGDGTQIRNWTYIDDIVEGTILAGEKINDGTAINLGTMERIKVIDAVNMVMEFTGHKADIKLLPNMPTGPLNRVADNALAKKLLHWEPQVAFRDGLKSTIDWYYATRDRAEVQRIFARMLTER
ncbi:MAG TPA: NAD-dependent epimerase/dehydratase family protein [Candidatus Saccharimonadales bacterium]|nr:NAD-dependent epimerase/dehydratase family protein [Candidatus Saccharimonadales bacterium]